MCSFSVFFSLSFSFLLSFLPPRAARVSYLSLACCRFCPGRRPVPVPASISYRICMQLAGTLSILGVFFVCRLSCVSVYMV